MKETFLRGFSVRLLSLFVHFLKERRLLTTINAATAAAARVAIAPAAVAMRNVKSIFKGGTVETAM